MKQTLPTCVQGQVRAGYGRRRCWLMRQRSAALILFEPYLPRHASFWV